MCVLWIHFLTFHPSALWTESVTCFLRQFHFFKAVGEWLPRHPFARSRFCPITVAYRQGKFLTKTGQHKSFQKLAMNDLVGIQTCSTDIWYWVSLGAAFLIVQIQKDLIDPLQLSFRTLRLSARVSTASAILKYQHGVTKPAKNKALWQCMHLLILLHGETVKIQCRKR